jgi:Type IV pilin-like G and H, putative
MSQIITQTIASVLCLGLAITNTTHVLAQTSLEISQNQTQNDDNISQKLLGKWQSLKDGEKFNFLFTPTGKLYIFGATATGANMAVELYYKINSKTNPMQLDVIDDTIKDKSRAIVFSIFEFTADGNLRVETTKSDFGKPRPDNFNEKDAVFVKFSNDTNLPANTQIVNINTSVNNTVEGKIYIKTMSRAQQAYFLEKNRFANNIKDLGIGIKTDTSDYSYRIFLVSKNRVIMTASAKKAGLKSYSAGVFVVKTHDGYDTSFAGVCETNKPSKKPLVKLTFSKKYQKVQCPAGSSLLP